jgi:hypothetical protein
MKEKTNNSPPTPASQKPTGQSTKASEARSASLCLTPEQMETAQLSDLIRMVQDRLKYPKCITQRECIQIGDVLWHIKSKTTALHFHSSLKMMRLTPVAAWDYLAISQNALLRETIGESESPANPNELAVLAKYPDINLPDIFAVACEVEGSFETEIIGQIREDVIINAGSQFGWPQIAIREGEKWTVTILPTKMGAQGTFFTRVGLHPIVLDPDRKSNICRRVTDAKLGGNPASSCPFCGEVVNHGQNVLSASEYRDPIPYWATYCIVHEITKSEGQTPYSHDPIEPFLLILNEKMISSVVSASMETADGGFFGTIDLTLDGSLQLVCNGTDPQGSENIQKKWSARLGEPAQLCVTAGQFQVYHTAPSLYLN